MNCINLQTYITRLCASTECARRIDDDDDDDGSNDDDGNDDDDAVTTVNQVPQSHVHFCIFHAAARRVRDKFHASGKRFPFRGNQHRILLYAPCDKVIRRCPFSYPLYVLPRVSISS